MASVRRKPLRRATIGAVLLASACGDGDSPTELIRTDGPDLIVSVPDVPSRVAHGRSFSVRVEVLNRGTRTAGRTQVRILHSADQTISADDAVLGSAFTDTLAVNETDRVVIGVEPPHGEFGTLFYGACIDPLPDELDPSNNCSSAAGVEIYLPSPVGSVVDRTHESLTSRIVGSGQTSYEVYRSDAERGSYGLVTDLSASGEATTYADGGLEPNTVYYYRAIACNGPVCSDESSEWGGLTEVVGPVDIPAAPTIRGEKVNISLGTDKARVHWDPVPWATYYRVYHDNHLDAEVAAPATSYYDHHPNTFLGAYQATSYRVQACNKAGCSEFSETITMLMPPPGAIGRTDMPAPRVVTRRY